MSRFGGKAEAGKAEADLPLATMLKAPFSGYDEVPTLRRGRLSGGKRSNYVQICQSVR